jgi:hypothetical protein
MAGSFVGTWSYRSLVNDPDLSTPFESLRFGMGTLTMTEPEAGKIGGTLGGPGWSLDLDGTATAGDPTKVRFQGRGDINGETWVYDYLGFVVPDWPNGVDQADAIVGTIVRTVPHSNGQAQAGFVASWYAVLQP